MQQRNKTDTATRSRFLRTRFLRFVLWAVTMCVTTYGVGMYRPRSMPFVPCVFLAIMVPAVLLPLQPDKKRED